MCEDRDVYILGACRTPIGRFLGGLKTLTAPELAAAAIREAVRRAGVAAGDVEEVILGNAISASLGPAPAKQAAAKAGLAPSAGGVIINQGAGSGLKAVWHAGQSIRSEDRNIVVAGGMENMSLAPHLLPSMREGGLFGDLVLKDALVVNGLWCAYGDLPLGAAAEAAAATFGVSRTDQDEFTLRSHVRAAKAIKNGYFREEIVRVEVPVSEGAQLQFETDEGPRSDMTRERLAQFPPAFRKDGTVTAAGASSLSDGAAALVLGSDVAVKEKNLKPLARVLWTAAIGLEPEKALAATHTAIDKAAADSGWRMSEVDLFEVHENFAVQPALVIKELRLDPDRVNIHGGALALGDPLGASGARILVTLIYALRHRGMKKGIASLSLAGGDALAMAVEVV
ncbi:MAG: acetyl-CoA C-acyltransferase [Candidatus Aminicenantes bacterium]|nr:acetyl-CoA C-acyltransferase [Candidatus Aminicenantes bacterium]